ncbi:FAD:protein FMN transferase [Aeromicrobium stalagmiti]|uniref:FAD:protein FMN transferase n=1 Tax=Aeromicrobium stalagmiti TaxID=2738988 RepID=UPI003464D619
MSETGTTRHVEQIMGLPVTLALRGRHARSPEGLAAWHDVVASLRDVDRMFSTYRADSAVSRVRDGSLRLEHAPPELVEVLAIAEQARVASDGAFDVQIPSPDGSRTLDPSGVVKGWAIERAAALLDHLEATDTCLSAGGDMVCRTRVVGSTGWRIGIEDPRAPERVLAVLPIVDGAVATSGTAHRGQHILDGRTGLVPRGVASVTVVTGSLTWADIDATAAFAHGPDAAGWLQTRPDRTGLVVWKDGTTTSVRTPAA